MKQETLDNVVLYATIVAAVATAVATTIVTVKSATDEAKKKSKD